MSCAEAIALVLQGAGRSMRAAEIAAEINRRGLYLRGDGAPLPPYQVSSIAHGSSTRFRVSDGLIALADPEVADSGMRVPAAPASAILIGCVSRKEPTRRAAKDLYRTELFRRRRAYAEATGLPWFIVSAEHGLLDPEEVIDPYDRAITDLGSSERQALARQIADSLAARFGPLTGQTFEAHMGDEYYRMLRSGLSAQGAQIRNPLRGLRIGEQLAWYAAEGGGQQSGGLVAAGVDASIGVPVAAEGLARRITEAFVGGDLDLSQRTDPPEPGWAGMPERIVAQRMRASGAGDDDVRLLLTFAAAMDRARDADRLWFAAERLWEASPWTFSPVEVAGRGIIELGDELRRYGVSQRHLADSAAWLTIAETLAAPASAPAVNRAVTQGQGDAPELLSELQALSSAGTALFPFVRGPKIGPMWVRMLAYPGGAEIANIGVLPVAVDVQVRKVTEYLAMTDTGHLDLEEARPIIQAAWEADVASNGAGGPGPLDGTAAALDPALWFYAKWGCTRCERAGERLPIAEPCSNCRFPSRS